MRVLARLREWSGVLALVLVLAGGTAYAANEWTGANIVNGSLTGADVQADSLRGGDVVESSFDRVSDAARLNGLAAGRFVQGASAVPGAFDVAKAKAYFNRVTSPPGSTSTFVQVPGLLHLRLRCEDDFAALGVISDIDGLEVYRGGTGRTNPERNVFADGGIIETAATPGSEVQELLIQAGTGENTFGNQKLVEITVHWALTSAGDCTASASVLDQRT
jgi:hypothetical protein